MIMRSGSKLTSTWKIRSPEQYMRAVSGLQWQQGLLGKPKSDSQLSENEERQQQVKFGSRTTCVTPRDLTRSGDSFVLTSTSYTCQGPPSKLPTTVRLNTDTASHMKSTRMLHMMHHLIISDGKLPVASWRPEPGLSSVASPSSFRSPGPP